MSCLGAGHSCVTAVLIGSLVRERGAKLRGMTSKPPKPPPGSNIRISYDGRELLAPDGWKTWRAPAAEVTVHTVDNTGKRVTLSRVAMLGPLALAAKKKSGTVSVVLTRSGDGATLVHEVKAKHANETMAWAVAFNFWREAVS